MHFYTHACETAKTHENIPIQIYLKFNQQKLKKSDIFYISAQNIDCVHLSEPPRQGGSNKYP